MLKFGSDKKLQADAFFIRQEVFVKEQGIPKNLEFDEILGKTYYYLVAYEKNYPVGTLRYALKNNRLQIDRLAVLKSFRHQGIGKNLVLAAEKKAFEKGIQESFLSGETIARSFYEKLGYEVSSEEYLEDGLPCFLFIKNLLNF